MTRVHTTPCILLFTLFILLIQSPLLVVGRFYYKDFRDSRFIHLYGSAEPHKDSEPNCLAMTGGGGARVGNQTGSIWYERKVELREKRKRKLNQGPDGFVTSFHFRITPNSAPINLTEHQLTRAAHRAAAAEGLPVKGNDEELLSTKNMPVGGDGFAFVFRSVPTPMSTMKNLNDPNYKPFGRGGSGIGYADLPGVGIVVEFDTKMDLDERDPNANHVSVHIQTGKEETAGFSSYESNDARIVPLSFSQLSLRRPKIISTVRKRVIDTSKPLLVQISYIPAKKLLKIFVNDLVSPILVVNDAPKFSGMFEVGFTATTSGESMDTHEICQWYFERKEETVVSANTGSADATVTSKLKSAKHQLDPQSSNSKRPEPCDPGFTGDSCTLDLASLATTCLSATADGCGGCLAHPSGHCQWCASQKRCISNELTTRSFDLNQHKPYCSDPTSIIEDQSECAEEPRYVLWGAIVVLFVIVVCVIIGVTGSLWLTSKNNATLAQDVVTLVFYTLLGSFFSICMTSVVNMVLTELTANSDGSVNYALGLFLFLFAALLGRDIHIFRHRQPYESRPQKRGGGLHASINYAQIQNPDDSQASAAVMSSFEAQRNAISSPRSGGGRTSSDRLVGNSSSASSSYTAAAGQRIFHSLTTVRGMMFVPMCFVIICSSAVLLCFLVLEPDWSIHYPAQVKIFFYTLLATSLLFTLAYLLITFWRLFKIVASVCVGTFCGRWCTWLTKRRDLNHRSASNGSSYSSAGHEPDLSELLSEFASTSLIQSVAQVRIMAVCAMISGMYFGHMFGGLDKEDTTKSHLDLFVQRENYYSYPLAAFLGAMSSFTNQYLDLYRVTHTEAVYVDQEAGQDGL